MGHCGGAEELSVSVFYLGGGGAFVSQMVNGSYLPPSDQSVAQLASATWFWIASGIAAVSTCFILVLRPIADETFSSVPKIQSKQRSRTIVSKV